MLHTPVLFLIFNRLDTTQRVFSEIKKQQPEYLYIASDGPRENKAGEKAVVQSVRDYVLKQIDWPCTVKTLFRENNLGCKKAVSSAITWFFENVEEGIILEDDCLPNQSFFNYCEKLLAKYRYDKEVMHIGAVNHQLGIKRGTSSYYFSRLPYIWGWATWRRAWKNYSVDLAGYTEFTKKNRLAEFFGDVGMQAYWANIFERVRRGEIDTWDYQWYFTLWKNNGIAIVPNKNLVSNIGFGVQSTHTSNGESHAANQPTAAITALKHPHKKVINRAADYFAYDYHFRLPEHKKITTLFIWRVWLMELTGFRKLLSLVKEGRA